MRSVTYWRKKQNSPGLGVAETIMFRGRVQEVTKCKKMFREWIAVRVLVWPLIVCVKLKSKCEKGRFDDGVENKKNDEQVCYGVPLGNVSEQICYGVSLDDVKNKEQVCYGVPLVDVVAVENVNDIAAVENVNGEKTVSNVFLF